MMLFALFIISIYALAVIILPFPHWPSFLHVLKETLISPYPTVRQRVSMLCYLVRDILLLPIFAGFWTIDEIFFRQYRRAQITKPVFIVSQPRSGTTFLLRTLSKDQNTFLSLKHLEWRYPYISFWKLLDFLGLRNWLENKSYWPNTPLGLTCQKIHQHILGSTEEFGIFLEERFYRHYFVFRRFPFLSVLKNVTDYKSMSQHEKRVFIETFIRVVKKVYFYRGSGEIFLTKENEAVDYYDLLFDAFPDARFLFIVREPGKVLNSYRTMSLTCTEVKHGLHPERIPGWHDANIDFRQTQCQKFIDFYHRVCSERTSVLVTFNQFTSQIRDTTLRIYADLNLPISDGFQATLEELQVQQNGRDSGYNNFDCDTRGFEFFADFVAQAENVSSIKHV